MHILVAQRYTSYFTIGLELYYIYFPPFYRQQLPGKISFDVKAYPKQNVSVKSSTGGRRGGELLEDRV